MQICYVEFLIFLDISDCVFNLWICPIPTFSLAEEFENKDLP